MNKEWVLTQDAFDRLLDWLDVDRDRAATKYEMIRRRLIKIFTCRGCSDAENLTDETINRVTAKVREVAVGYEGDPALYFYGVSHNVFREYLRKANTQIPLETEVHGDSPPPIYDDIEPEYQCLERCLERLPADNQHLVLRYYQQEKQAKIDHRRELAGKLGIGVNALRIRVHRIRKTLEQCVQTCVQAGTTH